MLVINASNNKERDIETEILQGFLVSPIIFLIYITGVFTRVSETNPFVISLLFMDDLGFIAFGNSFEEIVKALENVAKEGIEWRKKNEVTYDIVKIEAVFLQKSHHQRLNK